jgi:hypothetical protein
MWMASPDLALASPAPQTVATPSTKSVGSAGSSKGFHRSYNKTHVPVLQHDIVQKRLYLVRIGCAFVEISNESAVSKRLEWLVDHTWSNAIQPASPVGISGTGEGCPGQLLTIQAIGAFLRVVLAFGKRMWQGFRTYLVAETGVILQIFLHLYDLASQRQHAPVRPTI